MFSTKTTARVTVWAGIAALGLMGCAAQQGISQATSEVGGAQALAAGTTVNAGQSTYVMPALPPSAAESGFALTGEERSNWQQPNGRWVNGINGQVFVPAVP